MIGKETYLGLFGFEAKSSLEIRDLVDLSSKFSKNNEFILLLDNKKQVKEKAVPAYLNGVLHFQEKMMRTEFLDKEILILISNFKDIRSAVEEIGAKKNNSFIILSNSRKNFEKFIKEGKIIKISELILELDYQTSNDVILKNLNLS